MAPVRHSSVYIYTATDVELKRFCALAGEELRKLLEHGVSASWLRHYATNREGVGSRPDEVTELFQFT
jgi:hypothetical protein